MDATANTLFTVVGERIVVTHVLFLPAETRIRMEAYETGGEPTWVSIPTQVLQNCATRGIVVGGQKARRLKAPLRPEARGRRPWQPENL